MELLKGQDPLVLTGGGSQWNSPERVPYRVNKSTPFPQSLPIGFSVLHSSWWGAGVCTTQFVGSQFSEQGSNPGLQQGEHGAPDTRPQGSPVLHFQVWAPPAALSKDFRKLLTWKAETKQTWENNTEVWFTVQQRCTLSPFHWRPKNSPVLMCWVWSCDLLGWMRYLWVWHEGKSEMRFYAEEVGVGDLELCCPQEDIFLVSWLVPEDWETYTAETQQSSHRPARGRFMSEK